MWCSPPVDLILLPNEVHVWQANLDLPVQQLQKLLETLSIEEQERAERFRFEQHRQRFTASRGILRALLGHYLGVTAKEVQFCYGNHGKPALAEKWCNRTLQFNLSHSEHLALYALAWNRQVGIDLEHIRPATDIEQISKRFFIAQEYADLIALPQKQQREAFFRYWTCKEAYLKAIGDGIAGLSQVEISFSNPKAPCVIWYGGDSYSSQTWSLQTLAPAPNYTGALAVEGYDWQLSCWQW